MCALADMLGGIADPRMLRGIRYEIRSVLTVMVLAVLAGVRNFREIADRGVVLLGVFLVCLAFAVT